MRRVPPSTVMREEIDRLLSHGMEREANLLSELAELGLRYLVQQGLEQEQADALGRAHYERRTGSTPRGQRNGYEDARLKTAEGPVSVKLPQVRGAEGPYRSRLMEFLDGNSEVLERLVVEMYARGLSTRDVEDGFRDATGELLISKSAVSEITDQLWEDYQAFRTRDLSGIDVSYLFVDGIYESLRRYGARRASSVPGASPPTAARCCCISLSATRSPRPAGPSSCATWWDGGSRPPTSVTCDGAPGLLNAVAKVFSKSVRIRCWYHKLSNIRAKLPAEGADEVLAHVRAVRDAPTEGRRGPE